MINSKIDIAIGESEGNGGDFQMVGSDLAVVHGRENNVYLAMFGGNVEEDTPAVDNKNRKAKDYWANTLFFRNQPIKQFNSKTERTLKTTALTSAGRIKIENAVKDDLKYLSDHGAVVTVAVTLPGINTVKIVVTTIYSDGERRITIVTFKKKGDGDGDFSLQDFNDDFF